MKTKWGYLLIFGFVLISLSGCGSTTPSQPVDSIIYYHDKIKFEQHISKLHPDSFKELNKISSMLENHPEAKYEIICYVYSDKDSVSNTLTAGRRAKEVKKYLVNKRGISYNRLTIRGKGNTDPVMNENGSINREKSNRVVFQKI